MKSDSWGCAGGVEPVTAGRKKSVGKTHQNQWVLAEEMMVKVNLYLILLESLKAPSRTTEGLWDPTTGHNVLDFSFSYDLWLHIVKVHSNISCKTIKERYNKKKRKYQ